MTEQSIIDCISAIKANYGGMSFTEKEFEAVVKLWNKQFNEYPDKIVEGAVMRLISTSEFRPNIAMIKKDIANSMVTVRPEFEVWEHVLNSARNDRGYAYDEWLKLPEDIKNAITPDILYEIGRSDESSAQFYRKEVINSYNQSRNRLKNQSMIAYNDRSELEYKDSSGFIEHGQTAIDKSGINQSQCIQVKGDLFY